LKLATNAQAALDTVVEKSKTGDLSPIVDIVGIQRSGGPIPSDR
jgi:hypothetical protein